MMPKNSNWGQNTKAVEAKARKAGAMKAEQEKKQKAVEDAYWEDDDKQIQKKQNRKEEKEKKRLDKLDRKTTNKQLAEEEVQTIVKPVTQAPAKVTQAQIQAEREKREAAARKQAAANAPPKTPKPAPIEENLNRLPGPEEEARTVDEALKMLTVDDPSCLDKHPERRVKALYTAYEESRLPEVKAENPSLRLTQLKQIIWNEWKKSPQNPMNQEEIAYNRK